MKLTHFFRYYHCEKCFRIHRTYIVCNHILPAVLRCQKPNQSYYLHLRAAFPWDGWKIRPQLHKTTCRQCRYCKKMLMF